MTFEIALFIAAAVCFAITLFTLHPVPGFLFIFFFLWAAINTVLISYRESKEAEAALLEDPAAEVCLRYRNCPDSSWEASRP